MSYNDREREREERVNSLGLEYTGDVAIATMVDHLRMEKRREERVLGRDNE